MVMMIVTTKMLTMIMTNMTMILTMNLTMMMTMIYNGTDPTHGDLDPALPEDVTLGDILVLQPAIYKSSASSVQECKTV